MGYGYKMGIKWIWERLKMEEKTKVTMSNQFRFN